MNERLKELAFEAGLTITPYGLFEAEDTELERFAELVRQDEREACAKLCDIHANNGASFLCAAAIRARSEPNPAFKNYMGDNWAGIV